VARARRRGRHRAQSTEHGAPFPTAPALAPCAARRPPGAVAAGAVPHCHCHWPLAATGDIRHPGPAQAPRGALPDCNRMTGCFVVLELQIRWRMATYLGDAPPKRCTALHLSPCRSPVINPNRGPRLGLGHGPAHAHKINRDSGLRERAYLHAASRQVISQEIAELEAARTSGRCHQPAAAVSAAVLGVPHEPPSADGEPSYGDHVEQL
jgi:hypothetical protein